MTENATFFTDRAAEEARHQQEFLTAYAAAPRPVVTWAMIAINFLVFAAMVIQGVSFMDPTADQVLPWGADFGPLTLNGDWWRLITSCFLHFGIIHIGMNMFILFQVGVFTEKIFGNVRFLVLYLLAGIGGNIAGLYIHPQTVSAGASGAVFGVYGALLAYLVFQSGTIPKSSSLPIAKSAGIFLVYNLVYGLASAHTDMTAHVGGLITGFVVGGLLARPLSAEGQQTYPIRTAGVVLGAGLLAYAALSAAPRERDPQRIWYQRTLAGPRVTVGKDDSVAYSGAATKAEATRLAEALQKIGYFKNPNVIVMLSRNADGPVLSIPTWTHAGSNPDPEHALDPKGMTATTDANGKTALRNVDDKGKTLPWEDVEFVSDAQGIGVSVAPAVGGPPLKVAILNDKGDIEKELKVDAREVTIGSEDSVWYSGTATLETAKALGEALKKTGFFRDKGGRAVIATSNQGTEVSLVVRDGVWNDPQMTPTLQLIGRAAAKAVGGGPIRLHLLDGAMQDHKQMSIR